MRVHQLLAALSYGDAIGNEALAIQRQLRAAGLRVRHLRRARAPARRAPGAPAPRVPGGLVARDGLHLPLLDRQRRRPADPPRARPAGGDLPQHHAGALLPRLPPAPGGPVPPRAARARRPSPPRTRAGARRQRVQPPRARAGGLRAHRRAADRAGPSALRARRRRRSCGGSTTTAAPTCCSWAASSRTRRSTT